MADLANPLLQPWADAYGLPPFSCTAAADWAPAFAAATASHLAELDAIAAAAAPADFANTALAFDQAGALYKRLMLTFSNLVAACADDALQAAELQLMPVIAGHDAQVLQHAGVFARLDDLHARRLKLGLDSDQLRLVERLHTDFCLAGAKLDAAGRARALAIAGQLAELQTRFAQNVLGDEKQFGLELDAAETAALPESLRSVAKQAAAERQLPDAHVLPLSRSAVMPLLAQCPLRPLRQRAWQAWVRRGQLDPARDNAAVIRQILALRKELAALHGHAYFSAYALTDTMAQRPQNVQDLLQRAWQPALKKVRREGEELAQLAREQGQTEPLQAWDWRFYADQLRSRNHAIDDAAVRPYLSLRRMTEAMFDCAHRLFGVQFALQEGIATYHPDVQVYEVRRGPELVGIFLADNFARPGKRGGAWMNEYRHQRRAGGQVLPIVGNHNNFAKPQAGQECLLSLDDVRTLFHEFGHGLHGLLSNVTYERLSGTQVLRDFVELPSQLFEHWALQPQVLAQHARHVQTGEPIPSELVQKLLAARQFGGGLETVEYLASALLDQRLHGPDGADLADIDVWERAALDQLGLPANIVPRHRMAHFLHLFSSSEYAAAYYVYIWAETLDADVFEAFQETGDAFDPPTAERLLRCVYSAGNRQEPGAAFRAFRGRDPDVAAMLRKRGLAT